MKTRILKIRVLFAALLIGALLPVFAKPKKAKANATPTSIVALSPAAAEVLFAVGAGDQVAAISDFTDYPAEAAAKPKVGGFDGKSLSIESIISFKPDFVYLTAGMHDFLIESLDKFEIKYYVSKGDSIASVMQEISDIGDITGHSKEAKKVIAEMKQKMTVMKGSGEKPTVYYEVWNAPYMSAGSSSFINDVIAAAGGANLFADISDAYPMVSEETIIARQPEYILIPASCGLSAEAVGARAGWNEIPAVKNNRVFIIDDNVFTRPGPRIADSVQMLSDVLAK